MLDPVDILAFQIHSSKGVYALLLGSGVSRAAKIPTGWEVTLDLVRSVASMKGEDPGSQPSQWYKAAFGKEPDYSDLLDMLATTPTLRQQVVRRYIEPNQDERERGEKLPTAAHKAIANLMAKGYIRVVLTTNFDPLLEQALKELGINPTVIASADQVEGALPLVHAGAGPTIIKLHGDILDTRIRNTLGELSSYEPAIDRILDRVLDEFGLIVCGWSAEWDVALKSAIDRTTTRRFPMYWAARGAVTAEADRLIKRRGAQLVEISGADEFFDSIEQRVNAIETLRRPHPLSVDMAVAMLKEYIPEERHQIRLHDLLHSEFNRTLDRLNNLNCSTDNWSEAEFVRQAKEYINATEPLLPLALTAGMWSNEDQSRPWREFISELAYRRHNKGGKIPLIDLRGFPATLVLYTFCLGAVAGRRYSSMGQILSTVTECGRDKYALGDAFNAACVLTEGPDRFKLIPEYSHKQLPGSELVASILRPIAARELRGDSVFNDAFARVEIALAFGYLERVVKPAETRPWIPSGRFRYDGTPVESILQEWRSDYEIRKTSSELSVMAGLSKPPQFDRIREIWRVSH